MTYLLFLVKLSKTKYYNKFKPQIKAIHVKQKLKRYRRQQTELKNQKELRICTQQIPEANTLFRIRTREGGLEVEEEPPQLTLIAHHPLLVFLAFRATISAASAISFNSTAESQLAGVKSHSSHRICG